LKKNKQHGMVAAMQGSTPELSALVFQRKGCSVCHALEPKLKEIFSRYPMLQVTWIDVEENPALTGQYLVFTVPAVLLFYEEREQFRLVSNFALSELEKKIRKLLQYFQTDDIIG